ncbi:MAG: UDP-3-O-(3-hydroxymyristoyl)glucosamine N-acyltransferase [Pseudomonadales bacterium]|nr:UDP-3-O-(3-hydroxymyristoyl)glucosamine N-acyltransferase [Pseudomonadales bacterium]
MNEALTLDDIAARVGGQVHGDGCMPLNGLGSLSGAGPGQISHLSSPTYKEQLTTTQASAVILKEEHLAECQGAALVVDNPYLTFARVSQFFRIDDSIVGSVDASASIEPSAEIDSSVSIGANVVIGKNVTIAPGVQIFANTVVGNDCVIGRETVLRANVTLYSSVKLGERCVVHSGAVLGADGFGFTPNEQGKWQGIAQVGGLTIGSDVSIGANTCIDRGAIDDTVVEDGVQIDNLVQVGHNCRIGAHTLICGVVGLAGSTTVGKHCVFAGRSGAGGDQPVVICDGVVVSSCTVISQSVDKPGVYSGSMLFHEHNKWRRNALRFASLNELFKRVRKLERDKD